MVDSVSPALTVTSWLACAGRTAESRRAVVACADFLATLCSATVVCVTVVA